MADAGAQQQLRRAEGAAGADHLTRAHLPAPPGDGPAAASSLLGRVHRHPGPALQADGPAVLGQDPHGLDAGAHARPRGDGARQVGDMGGPLGVDPAPEGAGAALHAGTGVPRDRPAARAEGPRPLHA